MTVDPSRLTLHLERVLNAPRARVFAACAEPDRLGGGGGQRASPLPASNWTFAREGVPHHDAATGGEAFHLSGHYLEVDPPRRLVYTFVWEEPDPDDQETVVTLSLSDHGDGTKLVLDHGSFATKARYVLHQAGWTETLDRLAAYLA